MKKRIIPAIRYTNFRKQYPTMGANCFSRWFSMDRFWSGRLINIGIKHHVITLDFRASWIADMVNPTPA